MNTIVSSFYFLFSLTFCLAGLSSATRPTLLETPLLAKACSLASNRKLCESVLNSEPLSPKKNLNDLTFVALDVTSKTAALNIEFTSQALAVAETSEAGTADANVVKVFEHCQEQYESAVDEIDNSISALTAGPDVKKIETLLKDAITAVDTCQNSVKGQTDGKLVQLEHKNQNLLDLLNNALAIFHVYIES